MLSRTYFFDTMPLIMTERVLFQVQAAEMGFLRRVNDVKLRGKVRICEILKSLNVEPLLRVTRTHLATVCWFGHATSMCPARKD